MRRLFARDVNATPDVSLSMPGGCLTIRFGSRTHLVSCPASCSCNRRCPRSIGRGGTRPLHQEHRRRLHDAAEYHLGFDRVARRLPFELILDERTSRDQYATVVAANPGEGVLVRPMWHVPGLAMASLNIPVARAPNSFDVGGERATGWSSHVGTIDTVRDRFWLTVLHVGAQVGYVAVAAAFDSSNEHLVDEMQGRVGFVRLVDVAASHGFSPVDVHRTVARWNATVDRGRVDVGFEFVGDQVDEAAARDALCWLLIQGSTTTNMGEERAQVELRDRAATVDASGELAGMVTAAGGGGYSVSAGFEHWAELEVALRAALVDEIDMKKLTST